MKNKIRNVKIDSGFVKSALHYHFIVHAKKNSPKLTNFY